MKNFRIPISISIIFCFILSQSCKQPSPDAENIRLPKIFSDGMVLQQKQKNSIWGTASPNSIIRISIGDQVTDVKTATDSVWEASLPAMEAGGPYRIKITGKDTLQIEDVLVGEVWLASGQSNMGYTMGSLEDYYKDEIKNCSNDKLRFLKTEKENTETLKEDINTTGWKSSSKDNISDFSAVAYFFAKELQHIYNVPVGIINSSYGGTAIELWISRNKLDNFEKYKNILTKYDTIPETPESVKQRQKEWSQKIKENYHHSIIDSEKWKTLNAPESFEKELYPETDGFFWLKKTVRLPEKFAGKDIEIHLGSIDDVDATFFNNTHIGNGTWWDQPRVFRVDGSLVTEGENEIAIAVIDFASAGGFRGTADQMNIYQNGDSISIAGKWHCCHLAEKGGYPSFPFSRKATYPTGLYNAMIHPVIQYGTKGVIWYQGEANVGRAKEYQKLFPALIEDWRTQKNDPDWPFIYVQLANFKEKKTEPSDSEWARLREAQLKTLEVQNTAMAVTIDIGQANDVHPKNKHDVGKRLSLGARKVAYGEDLVYSGPVFDSLTIDKQQAIVHFSHTGDGLTTPESQTPEGFALAGADSIFYWADKATIVENTVVLESDEVKNPVHVRYGWADNPDCNLYNKAGLPASPFRTDNF